MICIIVSTAVNAVLDPLLILGIGPFPKLGPERFGLFRLDRNYCYNCTWEWFIWSRKYKNEPVNPTRLLFEKDMIICTILKIGLPSFVQQMLVSIGYAFITVFVNRFSSTSIAAFGIVSKIDAIAAMPAIALMMAASALTAQNIGAGKPERIKDVLKFGILVNTPVILMIAALCVAFPQGVMRAFVKEPDVSYKLALSI